MVLCTICLKDASKGENCWKYSPSEKVKSMDTHQYITIGINFQQVSIHGVKNKPPESMKNIVSVFVLTVFTCTFELLLFLI